MIHGAELQPITYRVAGSSSGTCSLLEALAHRAIVLARDGQMGFAKAN